MRHRKKSLKIGLKPAHRRAMFANMACSLIRAGRIETTLTRGKEVRRLVERMITLGKKGTLADRRRAVSILGRKDVVKYLFDDLSPRYSDRQGGYTRVVKLDQRRGDAADMCLVELVAEPVPGSNKTVDTESSNSEEVAEPVQAAEE